VLEITRLNLFGRDQTFSIRGRYGLLTRRGLATYEAPHLFHRENWRIIVSALYDNTADVNTFASERVEGALQAEQRYNRFTTFIYGLTFQRVSIDPIACDRPHADRVVLEAGLHRDADVYRCTRPA